MTRGLRWVVRSDTTRDQLPSGAGGAAGLGGAVATSPAEAVHGPQAGKGAAALEPHGALQGLLAGHPLPNMRASGHSSPSVATYVVGRGDGGQECW